MTSIKAVCISKSAIMWQLVFTGIIYLIHYLIADRAFSITECLVTLSLSFMAAFGCYVMLSLAEVKNA